MGWSEPYWPMLFGPLMMFIFVAICLGVMFFTMRAGMKHRFHARSSLDILKEHFARGEINQAEYEERKRLLEA